MQSGMRIVSVVCVQEIALLGSRVFVIGDSSDA